MSGEAATLRMPSLGQPLPFAPVRVRGVRHAATEDEAALLARARAGEREAFEELVRRHADRLHSVVARIITDPEQAQEVTQEAFLRAWRGIGRFQGNSQFFTWLYRIGVNEAKRRAGRGPHPSTIASFDDETVPDAPDWSEAPEDRFEQAEMREALERAVRGLPMDYRATVILRDVEGLSTREAAEVMELGEAAFKSRLHRARLAVRRSLDLNFTEDER